MGSKRVRLAGLALVVLLCSALSPGLAAQGCSQCRDNVSQTNPAVQASYRQAILIMLGATTALAITAIAVIRKVR